ncbi:MAG TPA: YqgE/AlgH family protein, partial [Nitrospiria bacterium]
MMSTPIRRPIAFTRKALLLVPAFLLSIGMPRAGHPEPQPVLAPISKGLFLVAASKLSDPNFNQAVVLIVEHGSKGTAGVIVNRPTRTLLSRIFPDMDALKGAPQTLYVGGP